ncbi:hypothetical protein BDN72DRAFT_832957 [Pluteus cervinus]|uniref:Uncharacterized protein n=1 Tax=Pluteus cervinus TaxID=181527 RepID=A0ACD3B951_9AGAR|nr:hypothetical protein BDN72DRAFT_832957 [Pluteus cervinus]
MAPSSSTQGSTMASVPPRPDEKQDPSTDSSTDKLKFVNYDSPFRLYPTLRMRSMVSERSFNYRSSDFSSTDISGSSSLLSLVSSNSIPFLDLSLLRLTTMAKWLDPSKQICQYEIPGGGECRDGGCTDLHLSRLGFGSGKTGGELSGTWCGLVLSRGMAHA